MYDSSIRLNVEEMEVTDGVQRVSPGAASCIVDTDHLVRTEALPSAVCSLETVSLLLLAEQAFECWG